MNGEEVWREEGSRSRMDGEEEVWREAELGEEAVEDG